MMTYPDNFWAITWDRRRRHQPLSVVSAKNETIMLEACSYQGR